MTTNRRDWMQQTLAASAGFATAATTQPTQADSTTTARSRRPSPLKITRLTITPIALPANASGQLDPAAIQQLANTFPVYQLDATAYPGNSGSPLFDPDTGVVYGVVNSTFVKRTKEKLLPEPTGITYAIPIRHARKLLQKKGLID